VGRWALLQQQGRGAGQDLMWQLGGGVNKTLVAMSRKGFEQTLKPSVSSASNQDWLFLS